MSAHTPGPWTIRRASQGKPYQIEGATRDITRWGGLSAPMSHEAEANARLIAAAPDLLEALQYVLSAHGEQLHCAFDMAERAIKKATEA
jgi:hypothetical protein